MKTYPQNKSCAFTNDLVSPLTLDSNKEYEICIKSLLCPKRVPLINRGDSQSGVRISVNAPNGQSHKISFLPKRNIFTLDMETILKAYNADLLGFLKIYLSTYDAQKMLPEREILTWDGTNVTINSIIIPSRQTSKLGKKITDNIKEVTISFFPHIAKVLGFRPDTPYPIFEVGVDYSTPAINPLPPQPTDGIEYVYIYCDIVEPTPFGGELTNILDAFDFRAGFDKSVKNSIYRPINTRFIPSISLRLLDQMGRDINYGANSSVTAVLNIREKKVVGLPQPI